MIQKINMILNITELKSKIRIILENEHLNMILRTGFPMYDEQ